MRWVERIEVVLRSWAISASQLLSIYGNVVYPASVGPDPGLMTTSTVTSG